MGIDIYAKWRNQTEAERAAQGAEWLSAESGDAGYLREAYHGEPFATPYLFEEAFCQGGARIPAATLRERLPKALELVAERNRKLYDATDLEVERYQKSFSDFVALCEREEAETGEPVLIVASY